MASGFKVVTKAFTAGLTNWQCYLGLPVIFERNWNDAVLMISSERSHVSFN